MDGFGAIGSSLLTGGVRQLRRTAGILPLHTAAKGAAVVIHRLDGRPWAEPSWSSTSHLDLGLLEVDGYAVLANKEGTGPTTRPCMCAVLTGRCQFIGLVMTVAETTRGAYWAAVQELAVARLNGAPPGNERWIHRLLTRSLWGYNLSGVVDQGEAEFIRYQLLNGDGDEKTELGWQLAKQTGCDGIFLPTSPPTLFVFERCRGAGFDVSQMGTPVVFP